MWVYMPHMWNDDDYVDNNFSDWFLWIIFILFAVTLVTYFCSQCTGGSTVSTECNEEPVATSTYKQFRPSKSGGVTFV